MKPGRFWFSEPSPYTTHDPKLGFVMRIEPVFINIVATSCAGMSVYIERMTARSSACAAVLAKRSLTSKPDLPYRWNLKGEAMATPPSLPIERLSMRVRAGLGSHVSMWEGAPCAQRSMTALPVPGKGGALGRSEPQVMRDGVDGLG